MNDHPDRPVPMHLQQKLDVLREEPSPAHLAQRLAVRLDQDELDRCVVAVLPDYRRCLAAGGTIFLAGCGGFAAHAQHMAAEFVVRYRRYRAPIRAIALGCNPAVVTAAVNDLGPEYALAREFTALARPGDLLVVYSTSGSSPMLVELALTARRHGITIVAWCPECSLLAAVAEVVVNTSDQERVLACDHVLAGRLEEEWHAA